MELIDAYVQEVGRHVPDKMRADLEQEIRSMIEDSLEDESQAQGKEIDQDMVVALLKRLGPPEKLAASYLPPRYLIGPELYPTFMLTLRLVLAIVLTVVVVGLGVGIGLSQATGTELARSIGQGVWGLVSAVFQAFTTVVLIFAIVERTLPSWKNAVKEEWDPRKLKVTPNPDRINPVGMAVEVAFICFGLVIFNLYPQWIGFASFRDGQLHMVSVLSEAFFRYLPMISLVWFGQALLKLWVLGRGSWNTTTRWVEVVLNVLSLGLLFWMLTGPSLVSFPPDMIEQLGWGKGAEGAMRISSEWTSYIVRISMGIALVVGSIELVKSLYRLLFKGRVPLVINQG